MNEELFCIIIDIIDNNDLDWDDLCDNSIFEDVKVMVLEIYSQFVCKWMTIT